jgi:hypothetical protein
MIDPLEVVITAAKANAGVIAAVGTQVAVRNRYGSGAGDWAVGSPGLSMRLDGGLADFEMPASDIRLECQAYAADHSTAWVTVAAVIAWSRALVRGPVVIGAGTGLLYHVTPETAPASVIDVDTDMAVYLWFMTALVAESAV